MIDKNLTKTQLRQKADLSTNVIAKMGKGQAVSLKSLVKICKTLKCNISDIVELIPDEKEIQ